MLETTGEDAWSGRPLLRIIRGEPDDAEIAALTVAVTAMAAAVTRADATASPATQSRSVWVSHAASLRQPLTPGPGAWRTSARPR